MSKCLLCGTDYNGSSPIKLGELVTAHQNISEKIYGEDKSNMEYKELLAMLDCKEDETIMDAIKRLVAERNEFKSKMDSIINKTQYSPVDQSFCDLITLEDFKSGCENGPVFTNYDGYGNIVCFINGKYLETNIEIYPSNIYRDELEDILKYWDLNPKMATHVAWYNK